MGRPPSALRALDDALRGVERARGDSAAVALAKRYAAAIDADPTALGKIGPLLLDCLRDLGMTPRSRAAVVKGGGQGDGGRQRSKWDELEERRIARQSGAAPMDSSAP